MRLRLRQRLYLKSKLGHITHSHLAPAEGLRLEETKQAVRVVRLVNGKYELVGYQMRDLLRDDHADPTAITPAEMMANAGLSDSQAFTEDAENKVAFWPILTAQFRAAMTVTL
jgi:hypothetical protein